MLINFNSLPEIFSFHMPKGFALHVQMRSYTTENVAQHTILDTVTELGTWNAHDINLHDLMTAQGVYMLDIQLVGQPLCHGLQP